MALFARSGHANVGHALETAVLHALLRRGDKVNHVRADAGFEVDFLARSLQSRHRPAFVTARSAATPQSSPTPLPVRQARAAPGSRSAAFRCDKRNAMHGTTPLPAPDDLNKSARLVA